MSQVYWIRKTLRMCSVAGLTNTVVLHHLTSVFVQYSSLMINESPLTFTAQPTSPHALWRLTQISYHVSGRCGRLLQRSLFSISSSGPCQKQWCQLCCHGARTDEPKHVSRENRPLVLGSTSWACLSELYRSFTRVNVCMTYFMRLQCGRGHLVGLFFTMSIYHFTL